MNNNKVSRRLISFALVFAMMATLFMPATPYAMETIDDIKGHWAEKEIKEMIQGEIIDGYPDGSFRPNKPIKRAEFASLLVRSFNLEIQEGKVFDDTRGHWAESMISTAYGQGIIRGYSERNFGPDDLISREQVLVMLVRALGDMNMETPEDIIFTDQDLISSWAREDVLKAGFAQISKGYPDGSFRPLENITRAEATSMIYMAVNLKNSDEDPIEKDALIFDEAGLYVGEKSGELVSQNLIVKADGVELKNYIIEGDLIIGEEVGDGDVTLTNIEVKGDTYIKGGGIDSIYINGGRHNNIIVQRTPTRAVRIVVTGGNRFNVKVDSQAEDQILILKGDYNKVLVTAPRVKITISEKSQINELMIDEDAKDTRVKTSDDSRIEKVLIESLGTVFEGSRNTVNRVEGSKKTDFIDRNTVIIVPPPAIQGGGSSSSPVEEDVAKLRVEAVTASPSTGEVILGTEITLNTLTEGASIYYSLDGSNPTSNSEKYTGPIAIESTITIKALAVKDGMEDSPISTFSYTVEEAIKVDMTVSKSQVIVDNNFNETFILTIENDTVINNVYREHIRLGGAFQGLNIGNVSRSDDKTVVTQVYGNLENIGKGNIILDGTALVNSESNLMVDVSVLEAPLVTVSAITVTTTPDDVSGVPNGDTVNVTFASDTSGATFHYTTDGSTPTSSSPTASASAITVDRDNLDGNSDLGGTVTVKVIGVKSGMNNSALQSKEIIFNAATEVVAVTGVSINEGDQTVVVGNTVQLTADVAPANATNQTVTWSSSDTDVATVDGDGLVTGVTEGSAVITVTTNDGGKTDTVTITVELTDSDKIEADKDALYGDAIKGANADLDNVTDDLNLLGEGPVFQSTISWESNNDPVIATDGTVTRPAAGDGNATVELTATITNGKESDTKTFTVTVIQQEDKEIVSVETLDDITVEFGTELSVVEAQLPTTVEVTLDDNSNENLAVDWDIAGYDGNTADTYTFIGTITLVAGIANDAGVEATINVIVSPAAPMSVQGQLLDADAGTNFIGVLYTRDGNIYYNQKDSEGNWASEVKIGAGTEGRMVIDGAGNPHVAYTTPAPNGYNGIGYRMYNGNAWTESEYIVSNGEYNCSRPSIAVDSSGYAHITYTDPRGTNDSWNDIMYARNVTGDFVKLVYNDGGSSDRYNDGSHITIDKNDKIHVLYILRNPQNHPAIWVNKMYDNEERIVSPTTYNIETYDFITGDNEKIYALYKVGDNVIVKEFTITDTGGIESHVTVLEYPGSAYSIEGNNGNVVVGGKDGDNLHVNYNGIDITFSDIEVTGDAVSIVNLNEKHYAFYTNATGLVTKIEIEAPGQTATPTIITESQIVNTENIVIEGTAEINADIIIAGGSSTATGKADGEGNYSIEVQLNLNEVNTLSVIAQSEGKTESEAVTVAITHQSLNSESEILSYTIIDPVSDGVIDSQAGTITVEVPYQTDVSSLIATFTTSDNIQSIIVGSAEQESGTTANDFTNPVTYVVTAEDGTTKEWVVTVTGDGNNDFAYGLGTEGSPFEIETAEHLSNLRKYLGNQHEHTYFTLIGDIDLGAATSDGGDYWNDGKGWEPIGDEVLSNRFMSKFNGGGFSITNLNINRPDEDYVGLFGYIGRFNSHPKIENLNITNATVRGQDYTGILAGYNVGNISDITVSGEVVGNNFVGGLIGENRTHPTVNNAVSNVNVTGAERVGGLIGQNYGQYIKVENSSAHGKVVGSSINIGGLIGFNGYWASVNQSHATGDVEGGSTVGGLIGYSHTGEVENSYASGDVTGTSQIGGLVGLTYAGSPSISRVFNCFALGSVTGEEEVGGIVGRANSRSRITGNYAMNAEIIRENSSSTTFGRVVGSIRTAAPNAASARDNYANKNMIEPFSGAFNNKTPDSKDGGDLTSFSVDNGVSTVELSGSIAGTITDSEGNPIEGAIVSLTIGDITFEATSDGDGIYTIWNIPASTGITITAEKGGYQSSSLQEVRVDEGQQTDEVSFTLTDA